MTNKLVLSKSQELLQTSFFFYNAMTHFNNLSLLLKSKMNHFIFQHKSSVNIISIW